MLKGFKEFLMRGNVIDLAVAVVIGGVFGKIVEAIVAGFINPLISAIFGKPSLANVGNFTIHRADFSIGLILDAIINFILVAAAIYFVIIVPMNRLMALRKTGEAPEPVAPSEDVILLQEIRDLLRNQSLEHRNDLPPADPA